MQFNALIIFENRLILKYRNCYQILGRNYFNGTANSKYRL